MDLITIIVTAVAALLAGAAGGYFLASAALLKNARKKSEETLKLAEQEGEVIKQKKITQAKEKFLELKAAHEKEVNERNRNLADLEKKLTNAKTSSHKNSKTIPARKKISITSIIT